MTIPSTEASEWSRRLWERLRNVCQNEQAWEILEEARRDADHDTYWALRRRIEELEAMPGNLYDRDD